MQANLVVVGALCGLLLCSLSLRTLLGQLQLFCINCWMIYSRDVGCSCAWLSTSNGPCVSCFGCSISGSNSSTICTLPVGFCETGQPEQFG